MRAGAGALRDSLIIQTQAPVPLTVTSVTRSGSVATVTAPSAHGYVTGDYATHAGAAQSEYNIEAQVTVTAPTTYTYTVSGTPATPATGTVTTVFTSDASGGGQAAWRTLATVAGQMRPLGARELLQAKAIGSTQSYEARIYYRSDVTPMQRVVWTPYQWPAAKTLEIHGVLPDPDDPRRFLLLDLGEVL